MVARFNKLLIVLFLLVGFLLRLFYAETSWINGDEGNYLYDAQLLQEGKVPFVDYWTKAPLYSILLGNVLDIFGDSLIVGRMISVIAGTLVALLLYFTGKELYNEKVGVIAMGVYSVFPMAVYWDIILKTEPLQKLFVAIAMLFLVFGLKRERFYYFLGNGLFLGLAFSVRRSTGVFAITESIFLLYLFRKEMRTALKKLFGVAVGGVVGVITFLTFYIKGAGIAAVYAQYLGGDFLGNEFVLTRAIVSRVLVPYWLSREAFVLMLLAFMFLIIYLRKKYKTSLWTSVYFLLPLLILCSLIASLYAVIFFPDKFHAATPFGSFFYGVGSIVVIGSLFVTGYKLLFQKICFHQKEKYSNAFLIFWFFSPMLFYFFYVKWDVGYFTELLPVTALMGAVVLYELSKIKLKKLFSVFLVLLIISGGFSYLFYHETHGVFRYWSTNTAKKTSEYIEKNTDSDAEFLTAFTTPVFLAGRKLVLETSHPIYYNYPAAQDYNRSVPGIPSIKEIITYLDNEDNVYVIIDPYTEITYFKSHPKLKVFVQENFEVIQTIDTVNILGKKHGVKKIENYKRQR